MRSKLVKRIGTGVMVFLIMACFIPATAGAFAPGEGKHGKGLNRHGHHRSALNIWQNPSMVEELALTPEQVNKVREADYALREKQLPLKAQLESLHLQMEKAYSDSNIDDAAVVSLAEQISDVKGKMFVQRIQSNLVLKQVLSEEQIEKLKRHAMQPKKRGRGHGDRPFHGHHSMGRPGKDKPCSN